jgi:hypothetical protein
MIEKSYFIKKFIFSNLKLLKNKSYKLNLQKNIL